MDLLSDCTVTHKNKKYQRRRKMKTEIIFIDEDTLTPEELEAINDAETEE